MTLTNQTYYQDKSHITNSMLSDFVSYEKGVRLITPESYYAKHISKKVKFEATDDMLCGTIADRYFGEWPHTLQEYPVVSKRSGNNPNEITNSMKAKVDGFITSLEGFKTFQEFTRHYDCKKWEHDESIRTKEIVLPSGQVMKLKGKFDFINDTTKEAVDQKTTWNIRTYWKDIQFRGIPDIYHRNIRQMTIYNKLTDWYKMNLAIVDDNTGMLFIPIEQYIVDKCWEQVLVDLQELQSYYDSDWKDMVRNPFAEFPVDMNPEVKKELF